MPSATQPIDLLQPGPEAGAGVMVLAFTHGFFGIRTIAGTRDKSGLPAPRECRLRHDPS
jgi:hypothetical protein